MFCSRVGNTTTPGKYRCKFSILMKQFSNTHEILHKYFKIQPGDTVIHTGTGEIKVNLWIVSLCIQQVCVQMQLLVFETQATVGILFEKGTFDQPGC